ncbi:hypothetical protein Tco_1329817 [Tanacetum coccineum]
MNDFKRNKQFLEKIASNIKFLNNLQLEWRGHVTIVPQTKGLHKVYYNQLYDFLKYNQAEVNELKAERLARTHDPLALMANSNNPYIYLVFHEDQPSQITYMQQSPPNNNYNPQPSFNQNYMQQPMINPEDIFDPTIAMNMALVLTAKAFKLNYSKPTNNNQRISSNPPIGRLHNRNVGNQNGYNEIQNVGNQVVQNTVQIQHGLKVIVMGTTKIRYGVTTAEDWVIMPGIALPSQEKGMLLFFRLRDLEEIEKVNANYILMANLQQASTSGTQTDKAPVYDSDGLAENDTNVISVVYSVEQSEGTVEQHPVTVEETYHNLWDIIIYGDLQEEAAPAGEQSSPPAPKTAK